MKISSELRQKIINAMTPFARDNPWAADILEGLTYKKRGRKVGWRKYRVLKPE